MIFPCCSKSDTNASFINLNLNFKLCTSLFPFFFYYLNSQKKGFSFFYFFSFVLLNSPHSFIHSFNISFLFTFIDTFVRISLRQSIDGGRRRKRWHFQYRKKCNWKCSFRKLLSVGENWVFWWKIHKSLKIGQHANCYCIKIYSCFYNLHQKNLKIIYFVIYFN